MIWTASRRPHPSPAAARLFQGSKRSGLRPAWAACNSSPRPWRGNRVRPARSGPLCAGRCFRPVSRSCCSPAAATRRRRRRPRSRSRTRDSPTTGAPAAVLRTDADAGPACWDCRQLRHCAETQSSSADDHARAAGRARRGAIAASELTATAIALTGVRSRSRSRDTTTSADRPGSRRSTSVIGCRSRSKSACAQRRNRPRSRPDGRGSFISTEIRTRTPCRKKPHKNAVATLCSGIFRDMVRADIDSAGSSRR